MLIVDTALARRAAEGQPVQVGLFGAGYMAKCIVSQVVRHMPGLRIAAICNRTVSAAEKAYLAAGVDCERIVTVGSAGAMTDALRDGRFAITDNPTPLCEAAGIDVLIDATGHVEYGAGITLAAIAAGRHMVSMNAELDATVGPELKARADRAGVILTGCDGDQPGVQINLLRFVKSIGLRPLICGNIKGLQDRYRTPETQAAFARQWGQTPTMVTSFADGTKISMEQAIVANATGMTVERRGMIGLHHSGHVDDMTGLYDIDRVRSLGGIVDYVVGPRPGPGVFVFAEAQDELQKHYLKYGKLGDGPLYSFYMPWHLTAIETPLSAARVVLFEDRVIAPIGPPVVDVVATAKTDLVAGSRLDGLGGFMTYGLCERYDLVRRDDLLPMGLAEGCTLRRNIAKDQVLTWSDVIPPSSSIAHELRGAQDLRFPCG
ncbi:MAG: NAD(P)-dependent oxidoreductase [Alphaproteobacteria bacterium]|nr:NAD(P)-dependent oxidoreductase [Alphaproteobacteria bacterium]